MSDVVRVLEGVTHMYTVMCIHSNSPFRVRIRIHIRHKTRIVNFVRIRIPNPCHFSILFFFPFFSFFILALWQVVHGAC